MVHLAETTYFKDKVYLPREVKEKFGLVDGDVLLIEVVEKGVARLSIASGCRTAKKALEKLDNPPDLGRVKERLSREEPVKILLDTNILVHAYNKSSPNQKQASKILKQALRGEIDACLTAQVIYEFFAVVTNSMRVDCPMKLEEAADLCLILWECREIKKK